MLGPIRQNGELMRYNYKFIKLQPIGVVLTCYATVLISRITRFVCPSVRASACLSVCLSATQKADGRAMCRHLTDIIS